MLLALTGGFAASTVLLAVGVWRLSRQNTALFAALLEASREKRAASVFTATAAGGSGTGGAGTGGSGTDHVVPHLRPYTIGLGGR